MNARGLRRYVDDLLRGRRPRPFQPDDFEAAQIRTAIELRAAGADGAADGGAGKPAPEFLDNLQARLAEQMAGTQPMPKDNTTRRQVIVGTSAAAAAAVGAVAVDRLVIGGPTAEAPAVAGQLTPSDGRWMRVAASSDVPEGVMHPFDLGSINGFVRRVQGKPEAVSGVCTHQGCRLWFDAPDDRLRCPCHSTSFAPSGQVLTHQLPIAPKPLPTLMVRESDGVIEVFAPARSGGST
ncbi:Rieske (2Fe-2S) protein [Mycobacterium paragordonae]|uniref:Rieske (2Fe-2S) protein n=1 Tax=Mycobacterium paragordonae TaxID=1389713 RepID=A0A4R5WVP3_9MYCO|nr:Rieske (2Fe-2S) protein [Mycobacterium paragordonae]MDP7736825.1 Rieske (2Fe-2S) protein [Mycobacterium paragordonae]TDK98779.1 Rieske (2Fe-2S) protein [Mycobacterium paragordonae]TDL09102.1 Rieske (2Fe-2S) protein [Mycobacterium paragordonae]